MFWNVYRQYDTKNVSEKAKFFRTHFSQYKLFQYFLTLILEISKKNDNF